MDRKRSDLLQGPVAETGYPSGRIGTMPLMAKGRWSNLHFFALPLVGAAAYPTLMNLFASAVERYRVSHAPVHAVCATLLMLAAACTPLTAAFALIRTRQDPTSPLLRRGLLCLMFATPPFFIFAAALIGLVGGSRQFDALWFSSWTLAALALAIRRGDGPVDLPLRICALRLVHGGAALCLLAGFLLAHLVNHDMALWSVSLHGAVMLWLRHWYRAPWVQPVLFTLLGIMILTGIPMVLAHARRRTDSFRVIQMATGVYLGFFVSVHVYAVLSGRSAGQDTDWFFGVGPHGLLDGRGALIAYYLYSSFFLITHAALGLRVVMLKHGAAQMLANRIVYAIAAVGLVMTAVLAVAAFDFHVYAS